MAVTAITVYYNYKHIFRYYHTFSSITHIFIAGNDNRTVTSAFTKTYIIFRQRFWVSTPFSSRKVPHNPCVFSADKMHILDLLCGVSASRRYLLRCFHMRCGYWAGTAPCAIRMKPNIMEYSKGNKRKMLRQRTVSRGILSFCITPHRPTLSLNLTIILGLTLLSRLAHRSTTQSIRFVLRKC